MRPFFPFTNHALATMDKVPSEPEPTWDVVSSYLFEDAGDDRVRFTPAWFDFTTQDFSIALWFKRGSGAQRNLFGNKPNSLNTVGYSLMTGPSNHRVFFKTRDGSTTRYTQSNNDFYADNVWTHVVCTRQGATVILYKNGISDVASSADHTTINSSSYDGCIGCDPSSSTASFGGYITDVCVWNKCLSPTEALQQAQKTLVTDGLIARYLMDYGVSACITQVGSYDGIIENVTAGTFYTHDVPS